MTMALCCSTLYSGQRNPPPLRIRIQRVRLASNPSDPQHPSYPFSRCRVQGYFFIEQSCHSFGLPAAKVAFANLNAHNLARAGYVQTGLSSLMSLYFRHLQLPLPFLSPYLGLGLCLAPS
jgi:hypothetical protein